MTDMKQLAHQAAPVAVLYEREAFEAWQCKHGWKRPEDAGEWEAWQARALLSAAPTQPAQQSQCEELDDIRGAVRILMDLHAHGAPISRQLSVLAGMVGWDGFQNVEQRAPVDTAAPEQAEQPAVKVPREELERTIQVLRYAAHPMPSPHAARLAKLLEAGQ